MSGISERAEAEEMSWFPFEGLEEEGVVKMEPRFYLALFSKMKVLCMI